MFLFRFQFRLCIVDVLVGILDTFFLAFCKGWLFGLHGLSCRELSAGCGGVRFLGFLSFVCKQCCCVSGIQKNSFSLLFS